MDETRLETLLAQVPHTHVLVLGDFSWTSTSTWTGA